MALAQSSLRLGAAALFLLIGCTGLQNAIAEGDTRTLSFHHVHTGEDITVTFKRDGRYDEAALKKLDWFMRDWRRGEETHMDPHLFDLLWETYREVGATQPIDVICGYRSPQTNAMLRARSSGVAEFSQHTHGQAMDFFIPGVPLEKIREVGLRLQRGGVGFYPTSGSPFVHLDTGAIRHWPRMTHEQLVKVFPNGRTVHIPTDGQPLPGYALALADVERHGSVPSNMSLEAAREHGAIDDAQEQHAIASQAKPSLLARLFTSHSNVNDNNEQPAAPRRAPMVLPQPSRVATERIVPLPASRPKTIEVAVALPRPRPAQAKTTTAFAVNAFNDRAYWRGSIDAEPSRPSPQTPFNVASAEPVTTGSAAGDVMAYAAVTQEPAPPRARPMGARLPQAPQTSLIEKDAPNTTVIAKPPLTAAASNLTGTAADPWTRAMIVTPSVRNFMTTSRYGARDMRQLASLFEKPSSMLVMTFSDDPHLGMTADRFGGSAVVFLATATFTTQKTASLR